MPATAAIDNETLDHLLSVVDDAANLSGRAGFAKAALPHAHSLQSAMRDEVAAVLRVGTPLEAAT
jgi:hypothetical protein